MNYGTPQEMIDEEESFNPKTDDEKLGGCFVSIIFVLVIFIIAYFIW